MNNFSQETPDKDLPFSKYKTDIITQEILLYLEGVQVPYETISITSGMGSLPSALITVPPISGLIDIARFYSPKVHIFYRDRIDGTNKERLLFSGVITGTDYINSRSPYGGTKGVTFRCEHKYLPITDLLIDYTGWLDLRTEKTAPGGVKGSAMNSQVMILEAMTGTSGGLNSEKEVSQTNKGGDPSVVPAYLKDFKERLIGIPGMILNYWQQLKRDVFSSVERMNLTDNFIKLYMPLVENGLNFFKRVGGHYFIEEEVESGRVPYTCGTEIKKVAVPPATQVFLTSAVQADMAFRVISNYLQASGEVTNVYQVFMSFFDAIDYDLITLASPAENYYYGAADGTTSYAIDTVIKPKLPYYYSPSCNVLLPGMYSDIHVAYDEYNIPTRVEVMNTEGPDGMENPFNTWFRSPHSVRKAIAEGARSDPKNLFSTTASHRGRVGKYEQGRGIRAEKPWMPRWLSYFSNSRNSMDQVTEQSPDKNNASESANAAAIASLIKGWNARYPNDPSMNPWSSDSGVKAHHKILFSTADYFYTQSVTKAKAGSVNCPFNPYIIPGYPMDIIESNPLDPSFHALCISVTHSFSQNSNTTSVSFAGAMTYSELVNYYVPFVHPWLQVTLGLSEKNTIVDNPDGKLKAINFYEGVLGKTVTAIAPEDIYDFSTGLPKPLDRKITMSSTPTTGGASAQPKPGPGGLGEGNLNLTYEGNLTLVYREIESRDSIEEREDIKFIKLTPSNYNTSVLKYNDKNLQSPESDKFELGSSQFLDYNNYLTKSPTLDSSSEVAAKVKANPKSVY
jgi:hypothetical protein